MQLKYIPKATGKLRALGIPIGYVDSVLAFASNLDWIGLPAPFNPYMTRYEYLRYTS